MKAQVCAVSLLLALTGCQKQKSIVILHDNDVHCAVEGYVPFAGYRNAVLAADTAYVATVSSGDFLQGGAIGSISQGSYVIQLMNAVGYDVVTLGNHEFDFGGNRMFALLDSLDAVVVDANFTLHGEKKPFFAPYTIRTYGSKSIAFVGATTPDTAESESYSFYDNDGNQLFDLHEAELVTLLQQTVNNARKEGADYVILLSHLGEIPVLSKIGSIDLIPQLTGIDAVLEGHTHNIIEEMWLEDAAKRPVLLTQTGSLFSHIGQLTITPDGKFHSECHPREDFQQYSDTHTQHVLRCINDEIANQMNVSLIHCDFELFANNTEGVRIVRGQETNLGNLVADAIRTMTGASIGLMNSGGIRNNIKAGEMNYIHVNDVLPFGNLISTLDMTGQDLLDLLEWTSSETPRLSGSFLQVSGLRYTIDARIKNKLSIDENYHLKVEGSRRVSIEVENSKGQWRPIDPKQHFTVATINFVSDTPKTFPSLVSVKHLQDSIMGESECLIQYLRMFGSEIPEHYRNPLGENRITVIK